MSERRCAIAYASRFGSTQKLAERLAASLTASGVATTTLEVSTKAPPPAGPLIVLSAIIWDRPLPAMRAWLADHHSTVQQNTLACGVVCGAAGVRETGGLIYAKHFANRLGKPNVFQFALSGQIPDRAQMRRWEWWALKAFAGAMRKPQLFDIRADERKATLLGATIAEKLI